ncbi:MAG: cell division protein ZapA [Fibrobacteria bacterium]|nr:cell division protein ZapA [Fibrobacteria bacterium]
MSNLAHTHKVNICGENFQIKSDVPANLIEKIAGYVDYKIKEVGNNSVNGDKVRISVLAAMNIAGELFEARSKMDELEKYSSQVESKSKVLNESLDQLAQF